MRDYLDLFLTFNLPWLNSTAASIIMATVYGYESAPKDDLFLDNADKAITLMTNSMFPGASLVNSIPLLRFFPSWFPGSKFHTAAKECRELTTEMLDLPYNSVRKNMVGLFLNFSQCHNFIFLIFRLTEQPRSP